MIVLAGRVGAVLDYHRHSVPRSAGLYYPRESPRNVANIQGLNGPALVETKLRLHFLWGVPPTGDDQLVGLALPDSILHQPVPLHLERVLSCKNLQTCKP